ncbi:MAG: UvrD-helicase domain-containing protein [Elusimicrobiota bacterium]|jgi:ATP-dependent exoDNAse (exonuclease V) beta subunit|nr:UvrD-helicase domain-containing protein [Elusimicrobiota bacterium]
MKPQTPQIISMQASAGSGKTYNLAKRYLSLLLDKDNDARIQNIIAVTFTNKAAFEMKRRIIDYLKKAALKANDKNSTEFFSDFNLSKDELSKRSLSVLDDILNNYDNFNVSTIDSFKNRILKACAMNIDISPNFTVEIDYSENLDFALSAFLRKASLTMRGLLREYLNQYFINSQRGDWIAKNDIYKAIEEVFSKASNNGKKISLNKADYQAAVMEQTKNIMAQIKAFAEILPELKDVDARYAKAVEKALSEGEKLFYYFDIPNRFSYSTLEYKGKNPSANPQAEELWADINTNIGRLCDFRVNNYYNIYAEIYAKVAEEFGEQAKKDEIVFINEINKKTVDFFNKHDAIMPEVYYRLSEKYRHFLIDEFQDTNTIQWAGIKRFLEESIATGGTFFYVGDAKQAIYNFRGGNSEIFDTAKYEFNTAPEERILKTNYRSQKAIVDFNNEIFSQENICSFLAQVYEKKKGEYDFAKFISAYNGASQESLSGNRGGYVEITAIDKDCENENEEIKNKFLQHLSDVDKRFKLSDIAVLCRRNKDVLTVSSWLLERGIAVESTQTLNIRNNGFIKQIISFLNFVDSPADDLALSSFITGDIFEKISLASKTEISAFLIERGRKENIYEQFREKYPDIWREYFEKFFVQAGFIPVYELVLSVFEKFKIIENFPQSKLFLIRFLELIKTFETDDCGLRNFLSYFGRLEDNDKSLYISCSIPDAVKVMTIHGAKGLQFPVVIIPFLLFMEDEDNGPYFDDSGEDIKLLKISSKVENFSDKAKKLREQKSTAYLLSELNVMYVGLTRAEYELYAVLPAKSKNSVNKARFLIGSESLISGQKQKYELGEKEIEPLIKDNIKSGYRDMLENIRADKKINPALNEARKRGNILHYALSTIISLKNKNIAAEIKTACGAAKIKFANEDTSWLFDELKKLFEDKDILNLFNYAEAETFNEFEIVGAQGQTFRLDKLIISDEEMIIADFKSSDYNNAENKNQLQKYAEVVREIYPAKSLKTLLVNTSQSAKERINNIVI